MADTGSPFNLPYPLPTDLVRDGADAIKDLAEATATGLSNIPVLAGIGTNVVSVTKNDPFSLSSATFTQITGLDASITPSSASSKVLVIVALNGVGVSTGSGAPRVSFNLRRGSTNIAQPSAGTSASSTTHPVGQVGAGDARSGSIVFLDSPGVGTSVNYNVTMSVTSSTGYLNRRGSDDQSTTVSSITVIEVAA
jgi:hypothetical protein